MSNTIMLMKRIITNQFFQKKPLKRCCVLTISDQLQEVKILIKSLKHTYIKISKIPVLQQKWSKLVHTHFSEISLTDLFHTFYLKSGTTNKWNKSIVKNCIFFESHQGKGTQKKKTKKRWIQFFMYGLYIKVFVYPLAK